MASRCAAHGDVGEPAGHDRRVHRQPADVGVVGHRDVGPVEDHRAVEVLRVGGTSYQDPGLVGSERAVRRAGHAAEEELLLDVAVGEGEPAAVVGAAADAVLDRASDDRVGDGGAVGVDRRSGGPRGGCGFSRRQRREQQRADSQRHPSAPAHASQRRVEADVGLAAPADCSQVGVQQLLAGGLAHRRDGIASTRNDAPGHPAHSVAALSSARQVREGPCTDDTIPRTVMPAARSSTRA